MWEFSLPNEVGATVATDPSGDPQTYPKRAYHVLGLHSEVRLCSRFLDHPSGSSSAKREEKKESINYSINNKQKSASCSTPQMQILYLVTTKKFVFQN